MTSLVSHSYWDQHIVDRNYKLVESFIGVRRCRRSVGRGSLHVEWRRRGRAIRLGSRRGWRSRSLGRCLVWGRCGLLSCRWSVWKLRHGPRGGRGVRNFLLCRIFRRWILLGRILSLCPAEDWDQPCKQAKGRCLQPGSAPSIPKPCPHCPFATALISDAMPSDLVHLMLER
jgi:hypothetical protein